MKDYPRINNEHISFGNWLLTVVLLAIPGLNLFAGLVYLFSKKKSKRNYILALIVVWLAVFIILGALYFIFKQWSVPTFNKCMTAIDDIMTALGFKTIPTFLQPK